MTARVRIGIVGAGRIAHLVYAPALLGLPGVEVVAVADVNAGAAAALTARFPSAATYASAAELAAHRGLDGVLVLTDRSTHRAACEPLLERGLPLYLEKPLAHTVEDGEALVRAAEKAGAYVCIGYMKRFDPAVAHARKLLDSGVIGRPRYAVVHAFGGDWLAGARVLGELPRFPSRIYGIDDPLQEWIEMWVHQVNLARLLFGEPEDILFASAERPRLAVVRFPGITVTFEFGLGVERALPWDDWLAVYAPEGSLRLVFPPLLLSRDPTRLEIATREDVRSPRLPFVDPYAAEIEDFIAGLREGRAPENGFATGLEDLRLCRRIVEHAAGGA